MVEGKKLEVLIVEFLESVAGRELGRLEQLFDNPDDPETEKKISSLLKSFLELKANEFLAHHFARGVKRDELLEVEKIVKELLDAS